MWLGTKNYAQGLFHEPRFYGQAYNSMLESLLAVPLFKLGLPLHIALPTITTLLTLFPFFVISILTYLKRSKVTGILILTIPLLLPIEYDFMTSISRGFVTGLAITSIALFSIFWSKSNISFIILGLLTIIGYSTSANSILLSLPCLFFLFLQNLKNKSFYLYSSIGVSIGVLVHIAIAKFYENNPNYILHNYDLKFSFDYFIEGIYYLNRFFNNVTPIFWKQGWIVLFAILAISFLLFKKKKLNESMFAFSIPFVLLIPLAASKVHDGTNSIFFSFARMYIAIPILLAISFSFLRLKKGKLSYLFIFLSLIFVLHKVLKTNQSIDRNLNNNHVVSVIKTERLYEECKQISDISFNYKIDLIIINKHWFYDFYNYGCPACMKSFPKTLRPSYERRTWRLLEDENKVYSNVLIIDIERNLNNEYDFITKIDEKQGFYVLENNKLPTMHLLKNLNIKVRKYN